MAKAGRVNNKLPPEDQELTELFQKLPPNEALEVYNILNATPINSETNNYTRTQKKQI